MCDGMHILIAPEREREGETWCVMGTCETLGVQLLRSNAQTDRIAANDEYGLPSLPRARYAVDTLSYQGAARQQCLVLRTSLLWLPCSGREKETWGRVVQQLERKNKIRAPTIL